MIKNSLILGLLACVLMASAEAKGARLTSSDDRIGHLTKPRTDNPKPTDVFPPLNSRNDPAPGKQQAAPAPAETTSTPNTVAVAKVLSEIPPMGWLAIAVVAALSVSSMWLACRLILQGEHL
jgi:hypothetical protein